MPGERSVGQPRTADLITPGASGRHSAGAWLRSEEDFRAPFNLIGPANWQYKKRGAARFVPLFALKSRLIEFLDKRCRFGCSYLMCNTGDQRTDRDGKHRGNN